MEAIHYLKARNSDFLSTIDLEIFEVEGKSNILKIKEVEYKENFMVNGRIKPRGLVITFEEKYAKPWVINPTNTTFVKNNTGVLDAKKWIGFYLELFTDDSVEMKVSKTEIKKGGIRIKSVNTNGLAEAKKVFDHKPGLEKINNCLDLNSLINVWETLTIEEKNNPVILSQKNLLKAMYIKDDSTQGN